MMGYLTEFWRRPEGHFPTLSQGNCTVSEPVAETENVKRPQKLMPKRCPRQAKKMARLTELNVVLLFADRPLTITEVAGLLKCSTVEASRRCSEANFVTKRREGRFVFVTHTYK